MQARTYLFSTLLASLIFATLVVAINAAVDPYGIIGTKRIAGFNQYKVDINEHTRLTKKYQPLFAVHNALIAGNSRVELGINPLHPCFSKSGMFVYNVGIPGAGVRTQLEYALNIIYQQPIETVFLSVDFTDFISPDTQAIDSRSPLLEQSSGEFRYTSAGELNPDYMESRFSDYMRSLFSLDALIASVKTMAFQSAAAPDRDEHGFNPARDFAEAVRVEGPLALFEQKMVDLELKYSKPWYLRDSQGQLNSAFGDLDDFLDLAAERNIRVYLFTNPFHQSFWTLLRENGHMPAYQRWMHELTETIRRHRDADIVFWDFAQDPSYISEPIPAKGVVSKPLEWFWEPAHYRRQLGDIMVDALLAKSCETDASYGHQVF
ncbi:MAG: hypothetical protein R3E64_06980 [Halioglobus sp.]